ncbi:MAG: TylF/MycF/NovP-related O-methyltransferase [Alphaproteobacteria bacterium]
MSNHLSKVFYGIHKREDFNRTFQSLIGYIDDGNVFTGDNLFTFAKSLDFLSDERFMRIFRAQIANIIEESTVWRVHTLCWAAHRALSLDGDFVECGSHRGTSARIMAEYLDFDRQNKRFLMFDVFDDIGQSELQNYPQLAGGIYDFVKSRFDEFPNVEVVRGFVPDILDGNTPEKIAFLHIDMNNAAAEIGALERLIDRVLTGGSIVLDDYGWKAYEAQMTVEKEYFGDLGYRILELPTGQGLVIK